MAIEKETIIRDTGPRETVVMGGDGGMSAGMIAGILFVVLLVLLAFLYFGGVFNTGGGGGSVTVDLPSVSVTPPGQ